MTSTEPSIVDKWANKMRLKEGLNEGRSWAKAKIPYIIITKKDS